MIEKKDIEKLASLSRIKVTPEEAEKFRGEIDSILDYVAQVKKVSLSDKGDDVRGGAIRNVLREDANPHESNLHKETLLKESPDRDGDFVKVKNIF